MPRINTLSLKLKLALCKGRFGLLKLVLEFRAVDNTEYLSCDNAFAGIDIERDQYDEAHAEGIAA